MARKIYGSTFRNNVLELNASDDRGIDVVREQIKSFASTQNVSFLGKSQNSAAGAFKLIVLDEADAMTTAAQGALRRGEWIYALRTQGSGPGTWQSTAPLFGTEHVASLAVYFSLRAEVCRRAQRQARRPVATRRSAHASADIMTASPLCAVIEQYTKNVRFCIICNYVNKIIPAIQSRCTRFRFNPLELDQVEDRLDHVIHAEE